MSSQEKDASVEDEDYFRPISSSLVYQWRKIRSKYPKNIEEETKAKAKKAEELAQLQKMRESRQNRRRGRGSRRKLVDEEDEEDERPAKRRKIDREDEGDEIEHDSSNYESTGHDLPPEVVSMVFDKLDLIEIYQYCVLVSKAWKSLASTKIEKAFERLNEEIKEHTEKYPKYIKCQDYFTRIKKLMPQYNDILPLVYHRIKRTFATKKDKRELFTISVEDAENKIEREDRTIFSFEGTGYVIKDKTVENEIMPIGCSKIGGVPDLPPSIEWPSANGQAFQFYAQLRLDEVSLFDICGLLPWTTGMLYIFEDEKVVYYDGVLAPRDHTGLLSSNGMPLKPESCTEVFFDLSFMKPDEETWHRGRYFDAKEGIQKKNGLHILGYPEFDYEEMPGFNSEEEEADEDADDDYEPEVPSTMLFGTISADVFDTLCSRAYSWTIKYDDLAAKNLNSVHFEIGGD